MRTAAAIGISALLACAILVLQGEDVGVATEAVGRTTRWTVFWILLAVVVVWVAVLAWDAYRASLPRRRAEAAAREAAAAAFGEDPELEHVDLRSRLAHMRLARLRDLREHGAVTHDEYEAKKSEILRGL